MNGKCKTNCIILKNKLLVIGLLLLSLSAQARRLSWDWWPTGIQDSIPAGQDTVRGYFGISAVASSGTYAPFWLVSNTHGDISTAPFSGNITAGIYKEAVHPNRWWDYDFAVQLTGRVEYPAKGTGYFNQLYAHLRLYIFDFTAGIRPGHGAQYGIDDLLRKQSSPAAYHDRYRPLRALPRLLRLF